MPLSEHEQNMLEQMERALYAEDPRFATQMKGAAKAHTRVRILGGLLVAAAGLACIVTGIAISQVILGGIGFAVMVGGVAWALTPQSRAAKKASEAPKSWKGTPRSTKGSWMASIEQRWERRRREG